MKVQSMIGLMIAAAFIAVGCGGQSGIAKRTVPGAKTDTVAGPPQVIPNSKRFAAEASAICSRFNGRLAAEKDTIHSQAELAVVAPRRAALERAAVMQLGTLSPPATLTGGWHKVIELRQTVVDDLKKMARYAHAKDSTSLRATLEASGGVARELASAATQSGVGECGRVG